MAYTIQSGDSLGKIAAENNISVNELMEINGISNPNKIYVGEEIKVSKDDTTVIKLSKKSQSNSKLSTRMNKIVKEMFNAEDYAAIYPEVVAVVGDSEAALYNHFINYGIWEGRQPNKNFNVNAYASAYADLEKHAEKLGLNAEETLLFMYDHYDAFGKNENREIVTIEKAAEAGITVTSIATANDATGKPLSGTVIAGKPSTSSGSSVSTPTPEPFEPTAEMLEALDALTVSITNDFKLHVTSTKQWSEYNDYMMTFVVNGKEMSQSFSWLFFDTMDVTLGHMLGNSGTYTVSFNVYADVNELIGSKTATFTYTKGSTKLSNPANVTYDSESGKVTWDAVENASGYYVDVIVDSGRGAYNPGGENSLWSSSSATEYADDDYSYYTNAGYSVVVRVKAYGDLTSYENSDWVTCTIN